jgi:hypothetical protein
MPRGHKNGVSASASSSAGAAAASSASVQLSSSNLPVVTLGDYQLSSDDEQNVTFQSAGADNQLADAGDEEPKPIDEWWKKPLTELPDGYESDEEVSFAVVI